MIMLLRANDGRLILAGGKFLSTAPGASGSPGGGDTGGGDTGGDTGGGGGNAGPGPTLSMALDDFKSAHTLADPIVQRKAGSWTDTDAGHADVPVLFSFTGSPPANPQARVVSADGGAVIKGWTALTGYNVAGATALGYLDDVPAGAEYLLQVRDGDYTGVFSNGAQRWGVGVCVLAMGQSNMVGTLGAGTYSDIVPGTSINEITNYQNNGPGAFFGVNGWISSGSTNGTGSTSIGGGNASSSTGGVLSFIRIVGKSLSSKYGRKIPVCLIPWAFNSTSISAFIPGGHAFDALFFGTGTSAKSISFASPKNYWAGDLEGVVWHQGETGSKDRVAYRDNLVTLYSAVLDYVAPFGRAAADLFFLPAVLGVYNATTDIENIRGAVMDFEALAITNGWPRARIGWNCIDLDVNDGGDGLHFADVPGGNQYKRWSNKRMTQAVLHQLGCAPASARGPRIAGATRGTGNTAIVTIEHTSGTALALRKPADAATGWSALNNGAAVAVTSVEITSATTITLTMAGPFTHIGFGRGMYPTVTNPVYDNTVYPTGTTGIDAFTGLPMMPTPDAIEVV